MKPLPAALHRLLFLIGLFSASPCLAARAGDFVERDIALSESCALELENFLGHRFSAGALELIAVGPNGEAINPSHNKIWRDDNTLYIGSRWLDSSGSIPRAGGPRFQFTTGAILDRNQFKADWPLILRALEKTPDHSESSKNKTPTIHEVELCKTADFSLRFSLRKVLPFSNQYGSEPARYYLIVQAGEVLPELRMDPKYD